MSLVRKAVIGGGLVTLLGITGLRMVSQEKRDYVISKLVYHLPIVVGSIAGAFCPTPRCVKRFGEKVKYAATRAALDSGIYSSRE